MAFARRWMQLAITMLSTMSQIQTNAVCVFYVESRGVCVCVCTLRLTNRRNHKVSQILAAVEKVMESK